MDKKINWGILAPGRIAHKFASDLNLVKNATIKAVGSRDIKRSIAFSKQHNVEIAYGSYEELAKDPDIDVIYIASPHTYHYEHTLLCLNNGKNVLCEKPIGMNLEQLNEMTEVAKSKNLFLMEALWTRFSPSYLKCKQLIKEGYIGDVKFIQADFGFIAPDNLEHRLNNKELGGGSLLDIGIYPVFFALDNLGIPDEILANAIFADNGVDINCSIILSYKDKGALANLNSSLTTNTPIEAIICGTKGRLRLHSQWHTPTSLELTLSETDKLFSFNEPGYGYQSEIEEVNKCLFHKKIESDLFPLQFSKDLHSTLDKIRGIINLKYEADR